MFLLDLLRKRSRPDDHHKDQVHYLTTLRSVIGMLRNPEGSESVFGIEDGLKDPHAADGVGARVILQRYSLLFAVSLAAYGLAWTGHFVFEKNRPATWIYPRWPLRAEWRMCTLALFGRLEPHLNRHLPGRGADASED